MEELKPYLEAGWTLIPLHRWDARSHGRERGKSPLHRDWTLRDYSKEQGEVVARLARGDGNVGARPTATQMVVDADPRAFPEGENLSTDNPLRRLCRDVGLDQTLCPVVLTGGGGLHLYLTRPADGPKLLDSLPDYKGVEFKTEGRQVVSAGSKHPSGGMYQWDPFSPRLRDAPEAPGRLLAMLRRPSPAPSVGGGGGEIEPAQLAEMLDRLDPADFRDELRWRELMMACHHATAGDGREEFLEWSAGDPAYASARGANGRRWDSLHRDRDAAITCRYLYKELIGAGAEALVPRGDPADDFAEVGPDEQPLPKEDGDGRPRGGLEGLNERFWCVMDGGQYRVMWEQDDPELGRKKWIRATTGAFKEMLLGRKLQVVKGDGDFKLVEIGEEWLQWAKRRQATKGVIFDPENEHEGFLNLWTGWGVEPSSAGSWERMKELLFEVLCAGDNEVFKYVLDWGAHMAQRPGRPAEVALCFRGPKGAGKSTFGDAMARIAGRHGMNITSSDLLTGRFNDHLRDVLLLHADEAVTPQDRAAESRLKGLITQNTLTYEGKGRDAHLGRNRLHVIMSSNERWVVPAGLEDERRFMVQDVSSSRRNDTKFFNALYKELNNGGYEAMLMDLLRRDIRGFEPRTKVPQTKALAEQKAISANPVQKWWRTALDAGTLPFPHEGAWFLEPVKAFKEDVLRSYVEFCKDLRANPGAHSRSTPRKLAEELLKMVPNLNTKARMKVPDDRLDIEKVDASGRAGAYEFPSLGSARGQHEGLLGAGIDWSEMED